jgi:hypothetical protein
MASLSRQLAQWVVGLRCEDPPEVVDRAKGVTLQSPRPCSSALSHRPAAVGDLPT